MRTHASPSLVWKGLRREVFTFRSGAGELYGSLYAPSGGADAGLIICPSWGWEAGRLQDPLHVLARRVAERGTAVLLFHWLGHGDSSGDPRTLTLPRMADTAVDAAAEASRRVPGAAWALAGIRLGAVPAVSVAPRLGAPGLLLIQPALDPSDYFQEVAAAGRRAVVGRQRTLDWWFGQPLPEILRDSARDVDVADALAGYRGSATVVRYASPALSVPPGFHDVVVPGDWRRRLRGTHDALVAAAVEEAGPLVAGAG
jgi:alpha-beta hydrolase superfamily lysophospholipase